MTTLVVVEVVEVDGGMHLHATMSTTTDYVTATATHSHVVWLKGQLHIVAAVAVPARAMTTAVKNVKRMSELEVLCYWD